MQTHHNGLRFQYRPMPGWPALAWLARCTAGSSAVVVAHGSMVEAEDDWFCEAAWDGRYEEGEFDTTDIVFGSGGRRRKQHVIFVSSGTTVDRLHLFLFDSGVLVSNSLCCLLAAADTELDLGYVGWHDDMGSITKGLNSYKKNIITSSGNVNLIYFDNLTWDGQSLHVRQKPNVKKDLSCFGKYRKFLSDSLRLVAENAGTRARKYPYKMLGTLSSGYDSPTIAVLAKEHGLEQALSFDQARSGDPDDGGRISEALELPTVKLSREAWRQKALSEIPFIAGDAKGEDVYFAGAEKYLRGSILLTGFHGDKVWAKENKALGSDIVRGDRSGLSLSEYRLWTGFIHCAVPFMGVRQVRDINAISNSAEMELWDVRSSYSRPICRRIVEEAGVPRDAFGVKKKALSVLFNIKSEMMCLKTKEQYEGWLISRGLQRNRGFPINAGTALVNTLDLGFDACMQATRFLGARSSAPIRKQTDRIGRRLQVTRNALFGRFDDDLRFAFPWAVAQAKKRYHQAHTLAPDARRRNTGLRL